MKNWKKEFDKKFWEYNGDWQMGNEFGDTTPQEIRRWERMRRAKYLYYKNKFGSLRL